MNISCSFWAVYVYEQFFTSANSIRPGELIFFLSIYDNET